VFKSRAQCFELRSSDVAVILSRVFALRALAKQQEEAAKACSSANVAKAEK